MPKPWGQTQAAIARLEGGGSLHATRTLKQFADATGMRSKISFDGDEQRPSPPLVQALDMLERQGPKIGQTLQHAADGLGRQTSITEAMSDTQLQLTGLNAPLAVDFDPISIASILSPIAAKYTMDAERAVHRSLFGELPGVAQDQPADDPDDLDFML